jgi:hypothetical protein
LRKGGRGLTISEMALLAYSVRRAVGALAGLLLVVPLLQFAVNLALTKGERGLPIYDLDRASWIGFPRDVLLALAVFVGIVLAWRLAGAVDKRAARADKVR